MDVSLTISPIRNAEGNVTGVSRVVRDVSEQKRSRTALWESESRFRQLADAMPQLVWAARPDGYVDYYNKRWHEYSGSPDVEGTGVAGHPPPRRPDAGGGAVDRVATDDHALRDGHPPAGPAHRPLPLPSHAAPSPRSTMPVP